jgi:DNA-directed RNA polymerase subunit N (RpoN/RPB10)
MIMPIRCFTCGNLLADEKLLVYEKWKTMPYTCVKEFFQNTMENMARENQHILQDPNCVVVINPAELREPFKYKPCLSETTSSTRTHATSVESLSAKSSQKHDNSKHFMVSPTSEFLLLNMLGVENICCRRMFLGYVNMIENIS